MALPDQFIRRWRLLRALEGGESLTREELLALLKEESSRGGHEWSMRTLQRDLSHLMEAGFPLERSRAGRKMRYRLSRTYADSVPAPFSPSQWAALYYALRLLRDLPGSPLREESLAASVGGVFARLRECVPEALRAYAEGIEPRYAGVVGALREHRRRRRVSGVLLQAIEEARPARILAERPGEGRKRWRKVDPYLLCFHGGRHYLLARESGRDALAAWCLEDIEGARVAAGAFQMPLELDLRALLVECLREGADGGLSVRVRFGDNTAVHSVAAFMEEAFGEVERIEDAGASGRDFIVRVSDIRGFRRWLMAFGAEAELLAPPELREGFARDLAAALGKYRGARRGKKTRGAAS